MGLSAIPVLCAGDGFVILWEAPWRKGLSCLTARPRHIARKLCRQPINSNQKMRVPFSERLSLHWLAEQAERQAH